MDYKGRLLTKQSVAKYVTAGKAKITLLSLKTGTRYTYRIVKQKYKKDPKTGVRTLLGPNEKPMYWVSVVWGSDNENDFKYIGLLKDIDGTLKFGYSKSSRVTSNDKRFMAFNWLWQQVTTDLLLSLDEQVEVWHEGTCGRCGRSLTVPASIEAGIGPDCAGKM
jgi:hypothetical protein